MKLSEIVAISGMSGVYKVVSQHKSGLVLENVQDKKRISTSMRHRASNLNDISIYTQDEDLPLRKVFLAVKEWESNGGEVPTSKADKATLEQAMESVVPDYDKERVYHSDMKKLFSWYHMIKADLDFESLNTEEETPTSETAE